jgi:hypothetical protein
MAEIYMITAADRGKTVNISGTLSSLTYQAKPSLRGDSHHRDFRLLDEHGQQLFNLQITSQAIPVGTVFPMYDHPFESLTVADIPGGSCAFLATYEGPPIDPPPEVEEPEAGTYQAGVLSPVPEEHHHTSRRR